MAKKDGYGAEAIQVLKGLEGVRKRPGMYIGDTDDGVGLHHMVFEVLDNAIDEIQAGHATRAVVTMGEDWASVEDNGRGIPVDKHPTEEVSALQVVMTILHAGGKFDQENSGPSGGLHGVGVSVVNALSSKLVATVWRDGGIYEQEYSQGIPKEKVKQIGEAKVKHGTRVTFWPDPTVFRDVKFKPAIIAARMEEMAYLNPGCILVLRAEGQEEQVFHKSKGLVDMVRGISEGLDPIGPVVHIEGTQDRITVDCAIQWTKKLASSKELAYVNCIRNPDGGTHLTGLRKGVTRAVLEACKEEKLKGQEEVTGDDIREGLVAVVSIRMPDPKFSSQTKEKLISSNASAAVGGIVADGLLQQLESNPELRRAILRMAIIAAKARIAAREAREGIRKAKFEESIGAILPGKLSACQSKDIRENELFLVEGDSAGGSAKSGRDRRFQAILPLRGKTLNVEGELVERIRDNEELMNIVKALGTGFGPSFDLAGLRYGKVIIMTDADVDGSHIRTLLLTFFYRQMQPLILDGRVYVARPPLFGAKVPYENPVTGQRSWRHRWLRSERELEEAIKAANKMDLELKNLQRYKGLGEMNPEQLWETTLDPDRRLVEQVVIHSHPRADALFQILMGDEVPIRRQFISDNAQYARVDV